MKLDAFLCSARIWLVAALAVTMGFGTAAADIHPVSPDEIACQSADSATHIADVEQDSGDERDDYHHHAHNCGSCHVHFVGMRLAGLEFSPPISTAFRLDSASGVPLSGPFGLYRPPRA